tara:strand:- start:1260 stop:1925 length:666 start_codon:yes stop_codon:yes gene_type:complete
LSARSNAGRIGIWGRSGSGKSSYAKKLLKGRRRVVVFDPLDEYSAEGIKRTAGHDLDAVRVAMRGNWSRFRLAYVPPAGSEDRALSGLCRLLMAAQEPFRASGKGAQITLVVEELNMSFPSSGGVQKCPGFAEICSRGRHYGIEVIGLSQRLAEVNTRFRGNCTETVIFAQKGPRDQKAAREELGAGVALPTSNLQYVREKGGEYETGELKFSKSKKHYVV